VPRYQYRCGACGAETDQFRLSVARDEPAVCVACGSAAARVFTPPMVSIPAHFALKHLTAGWHLPRLENGKVDYSNLCRPGEIRAKPDTDEGCEKLGEHLKETLLGKREKIALTSGGS
jgi:putative FmdB family regulatory protein